MLTIIKHRVNAIVQFEQVHPTWGVEIDLRSDVTKPGKIHLSHDPWVIGDDFGEWLNKFVERGIQGPLILNTKEDGLETRLREQLEEKRIANYFFLDTAPPTLVSQCLLQGHSQFAVRLSSYEPVESVAMFSGKAKWLWVDCFKGIAPAVEWVQQFREKFKICLVSPELHGYPVSYKRNWGQIAEYADAVCTKYPEQWVEV